MNGYSRRSWPTVAMALRARPRYQKKPMSMLNKRDVPQRKLRASAHLQRQRDHQRQLMTCQPPSSRDRRLPSA